MRNHCCNCHESANSTCTNCSAIKMINIINKKEILLYGNNLDLLGKSITVTDGINAPMLAYYSTKQGTFVIDSGELNPSVNYQVHADWINIPCEIKQISIPNLIKVMQTAKNQIKLIYDRPVNVDSAINCYNYWVQSNEKTPTSIATMGASDSVSSSNSLKPFNSYIAQSTCCKNEFFITFRLDITPGIDYKVIPCNIAMKGLYDYIGANFTSNSPLVFKGK